MVPRPDDSTHADVQLADRVGVHVGGSRGDGGLFFGSFLLGGLFGGLFHFSETGNGHMDVDRVVVEVDVRHGKIGAGRSRNELHVGIPTNDVHKAVVTLERALRMKKCEKTERR